MDVTPELLEIALDARREAMARITFRKVERPGTSAIWQLIEMPQHDGEFIHESVETVRLRQFTYERAARIEYDRIIMRGILDAVANHLVKGQTLSPSQAA